jgi:hypothetical protein
MVNKNTYGMAEQGAVNAAYYGSLDMPRTLLCRCSSMRNAFQHADIRAFRSSSPIGFFPSVFFLVLTIISLVPQGTYSLISSTSRRLFDDRFTDTRMSVS